MLAAAGLPQYIIAYFGGWCEDSKSLQTYTQLNISSNNMVSKIFSEGDRASLEETRIRHTLCYTLVDNLWLVNVGYYLMVIVDVILICYFFRGWWIIIHIQLRIKQSCYNFCRSKIFSEIPNFEQSKMGTRRMVEKLCN